MLSSTNLSDANWSLGEILTYGSDGYTDFSPVPRTNAMAFFKAHHADRPLQIRSGLDARDPNPANNAPAPTTRFFSVEV